MRRVLGIFAGTIIATYAVPAGAIDLYPNFDGDWERIKWGGFFVAPYFWL
jgi:hypothetical protein